jgi:hypothetical protein
VRLVASREPRLANPVYGASVATVPVGVDGVGTSPHGFDMYLAHVAKPPITGLLPDTKYYYGIEINGTVYTSKRGTFRTLPSPSVGTSFKFGFGACSMWNNNGAWPAIAAHDPLFFIAMGDTTYLDNWGPLQAATTYLQDEGMREHAMNRYLENAEVLQGYRNIPMFYSWSDHDFFGNDIVSDSDGVNAANVGWAQAWYRKRIPHLPLAAADTINYSFVVGRVRFVIPDCRSATKLNTTIEAFGATQKQWIKDEVAAASAAGQFVVFYTERPWISDSGDTGDSWLYFRADQTELANYFKSLGMQGKMMIIAGDAHMLAYDTGANADYATGGGMDIPTFQAAAIDQTGSSKGGTYSSGKHPGGGQYGMMIVNDTGGNTIEFTFQGHTLANKPLYNYTFTSAALTAPTPSIPIITSVTVSDTTPSVDELLTASVAYTGYPSPTLVYQWKADGGNVGSNSANYTVQSGDAGKAITVTVTATNASGSDTETSAATSPVAGAPVNFIANGTFTDLTGWEGYKYENSTVTRDDTVLSLDAGRLRVTNPVGGANYCRCRYTMTGLTIGATYSVSAWIAALNATTYLAVTSDPTGAAFTDWNSGAIVGTYTIPATFEASATTLYFFGVMDSSDDGATFVIDNVSVMGSGTPPVSGSLAATETGVGTATITGTVAADTGYVVNGDFSSTTLPANISWYSIGPSPTYENTYSDAVGAVVGGRFRVTNPATRAYPYAIYTIPLSAGQYDVSVELPAGTSYGEVRTYTNMSDPEGSTLAPLIVITPGQYPASRSFTITHPGGNLYLSAGIQTETGGDWVEFDNISVRNAEVPAFNTGVLAATEVGLDRASIYQTVSAKTIPAPPGAVSGYNQIFLEDWTQGLRLRSNTQANNAAISPTNNDYGYPDGGYQAGTGLWQPHLKWPNAALVAHHGLPSAFANLHHPDIQTYAPDVCKVVGNELVTKVGPIPGGLTVPTAPDGTPYTYLSAQLSTRWSFYCVFGWLEVCVWLKPVQGLFAAPLWFTGQLWPPEIDVSEVVDNTQHQSIHSDGYNTQVVYSKHLTAFPAGGGYMRFASLWLPDRIESWYADGLDGSWVLSGTSMATSYNQAQMNQAQYLITGMACNTPWAGAVDESQMPFTSKIHYIRVLQAPGGRYHYGLGANSPEYSTI